MSAERRKPSVVSVLARAPMLAMTPVLALALATALAPRPALAYRTAADFPEFAGTERVRWATPVIRYERSTRTPSTLSSTAVADLILRAGSTWSAPSCSAVLFDNGGVSAAPATPEDGRNTIEWRSADWESLGAPPEAAGVTDVQYEKDAGGTWHIVESDLYLNVEHHVFSIDGQGPAGARDLLSVLTHEFGHVAGLAHPCEIGGAAGAPDCSAVPGVSEATMYPLYSVEQASLAADDIDGICFLYPAGDCEAGCPEGSVCSPEGCRPACGDSYCPSNQICDGDRCVPIDSVDAGCGSLGCNPDGRCTTDAQCPPDQRCQNGTCARGRARLGDPCIESADCAEGTCSADGHCAVRCATNAECERGERCDTTQTLAACTGRGALGATCSESNQCLGEQCLAGVSEDPICTRLCGPLLTPCPSGWQCLPVDTRSVCAPEPELTPAGGGGCQLPNTPPTSRAPLALLALALTLTAFRRRRPRPRKEITA